MNSLFLNSKVQLARLGLMSLAGASVAGYHGYKRNSGSLKWTLIWMLAGIVSPLTAGGLALYQGYGKRK